MATKHTFRYLKSTSDGIEEVIETRDLTMAKAIRFMCLDCSGGQSAEVRTCGIKMCPLWPFRFGRYPK